MFNQFWQGMLNLVYPPCCLICNIHHQNSLLSPGQDQNTINRLLCASCQKSLVMNHPRCCPKCSRHLDSAYGHRLCKDCREHDIHFDFAWGAYLYQNNLKTLLHQFKYHQTTYLSQLFCAMMTRYISTYHLDIHQFDLLLPLPLSQTRQRERGYNQSALLAQGLSRIYGIPVITHCLRKVKNTLPQAQLGEKERWTNISGAFTIRHSEVLSGRSILLIDDLLTTGATVNEATITLKSAGVSKVGVFALAIN
ncbi:MAG: ComF family protein [Candidatus Omnitrophica bacterium]|nr:ComF family protein [Candidatus Omnitrophota bacterium]